MDANLQLGLVYFITIFVVFQMKHLLADYFLQTPYMLGKFKDEGWVKPLSAHCGVHAAFTFLILACFIPSAPFWLVLSLVLFDFVVHFVMDRIKASPKLLGRFKTTDREFWLSLGVDQTVHHLTHYAIIFILYSYLLGTTVS